LEASLFMETLNAESIEVGADQSEP